MDINLLRQIITVAGLVCFAAIALWAYGKPASQRFDEAAMQPINDDDLPHRQGREQ
ncbi:cbb3-type cytochrome oxidase subunit 3 [Chitinimonas sp. BJB300]|uniref:cbb3-type cytochrome oxidase subunit 3 n=1 Tax=Chitinimonas sp. BJB300 TaxID=1559339 RepID=UPI000C0DA365|nr:CcoQ/FixQ family Cbb3-type cytochrome c oxidase assembly chaperone [Chitinimonas sp. BJB300]PHV11651.1 CcoQ/FixQ family Cbb3-type cytochrome c oxidase assembly chaperone [Chitinimonas sp. BJB300]TSJ85607.1 CcoQ/FixQ family Cbb3-type cytochrome c oxidase assembly chaperone [Chitinimonas sp. BJB300]